MRKLWRKMHKWLNSLTSLLWGVLVGFIVLGLAVVWGFIQQDHTNTQLQQQAIRIESDRVANEKAACLAGDEVRDLIRRIGKDAPLEIGEAIIEVASKNTGKAPTQAVVDAFRAAEQRRLDSIVNQLPARRWDEDKNECVDLPLTHKEQR